MEQQKIKTGSKVARRVASLAIALGIGTMAVATIDCAATPAINRPCIMAHLKGVLQGKEAELEHIAHDLQAENNVVDFAQKGDIIYVIPSGYRFENRNGQIVGVKTVQAIKYYDEKTGQLIEEAPEGAVLVHLDKGLSYAEEIVPSQELVVDRDTVYYKQMLTDRPVVAYNEDGSPMAVPITYVTKEDKNHVITGEYALDWQFGYYYDNNGTLVNTRDGITQDAPVLVNNTEDSWGKKMVVRR